MTIAIFTEPEVTNKIALVIIRKNKTETKICESETSTNLAAILKTESRHCYNSERERTKFSTNQRVPFSIITSAILLIVIMNNRLCP